MYSLMFYSRPYFLRFITFLQMPSDVVVRYQAIDIVGIILSFIW